jgi:hypothetical protein
MWDIWQLGAIQMLALIELGTPDVQSVVSRGNVNGSGLRKTGSTGAVWRGIHELWGNSLHMVDGLVANPENRLFVRSSENQKAWLDVGAEACARSGWISAFESKVPAAFVPSETGSDDEVVGDYYWPAYKGEENICYHGGDWSNGSYAGLFHLYLSSVASNSSASLGCRLAKR